MHLCTKFKAIPNTNALAKRGVVARRACVVCGRHFIQKPWYVNFFGFRKWMETKGRILANA